MEFKPNSVNQITKGTLFFRQGYPVEVIGMLVKGRAEICSNGVSIAVGSGSFLGLNDLYHNEFTSDYKALDDLIIYIFPASTKASIGKILSLNKDYQGLAVFYLERLLSELCKDIRILKNTSEEVYQVLLTQYENYQKICKQTGHTIHLFAAIQNLKSPKSLEKTFDDIKLNAFIEAGKIPIDIQKAYYGNSLPVTVYQITELSVMIDRLFSQALSYTEYLEETLPLLIHGRDQSLFVCEATTAADLKKDKQDVMQMTDMMEVLIDKINCIETELERNTTCKMEIDREWLEQVYANLIMGDTTAEILEVDAEHILLSLKGSLRQIISYGDLEKEKAEALSSNIQKFVECKSRMDSDDGIRRLRKMIEEQFYDLYYKVFLQAYQKNELPKAIELFLDYGFLDERLITQDQLREICVLKQSCQGNLCRVYTMREWLTAIYQGEKEPSKNDFSEDYSENLRQQKKNGTITPEQETVLLKDQKKKLEFEIKNAFRSSSRLVNGQVLSFVPVLHEDMLYSRLSNAKVTKLMVDEIMQKLLGIDFSVFHREALYTQPEKGIEKEYIMQQVLPDIIISPVVGSGGAMWQEISGRRRNTPGRFMIPSLAMGNLEDIFVHLFGQFRWELCKTMQGVNWNNIQYRSMTAEYADYIQFYRKNRDLTPEKKEKVKLQIQKGRNLLREIFTMDYETWVKNETIGSIRLNKVAREIFASYCPFKKEYRMPLEKQPIYEEAFARFEREKTKKIKELELRLFALEKARVVVPEEIHDTIRFYREN